MKTINTHIKASNPWWDYMVDDYTVNNVNSTYHYVSTHGSTFVIPKIGDDKYLLIKQERYLNKKSSLEFPGGGQKKELSKIQNIKNELEEETGLIGNNFIELGVFNPYIGVTNELSTIYYCDSFIKSKQNLEDTEIISTIEMSSKEIDEAILSNKMWSGISIVAWTFYKLKKGDLK